MTTVSTRPSFSAATTARRLRDLMRDRNVTVGALAWILGCSRIRALRLTFGSTSWTCTEAYRLVEAVRPTAAVPTTVAAVFAEAAA